MINNKAIEKFNARLSELLIALDKRLSNNLDNKITIKQATIKPDRATDLLAGQSSGVHTHYTNPYGRKFRLAPSDNNRELIMEFISEDGDLIYDKN